jgi:hypothetical protein
MNYIRKINPAFWNGKLFFFISIAKSLKNTRKANTNEKNIDKRSFFFKLKNIYSKIIYANNNFFINSKKNCMNFQLALSREKEIKNRY